MMTAASHDTPGAHQGEQLRLNRSERAFLESQDEATKAFYTEKLACFKKDAAADVPRRFKVAASNLPQKSEIFRRLEGCESAKYESWVDYALGLPLGKFSQRPLESDAAPTEIASFLHTAREAMDRAIHGQERAKDEVVHLISQWARTGSTHASGILLQGPPGVGKTAFAKRAIAAAINRPFVFIAMGGANDSSYLMGHSYTFEGAVPGRIAEALREAKVMDPVIFVDELDKISKSPRGEDLANALLHLTDKGQNAHIRDKYFHGIDLDLSRAIFVFSANDLSQINPVLLDRLNVIQMASPTQQDKLAIAKQHLLPKAMTEAGITDAELLVPDEAIEQVIEAHADESGVRGLERTLARVVNTAAVLLSGATCLRHAKLTLPERCEKGTVVCSSEFVAQVLAAFGERKEPSCPMMYS